MEGYLSNSTSIINNSSEIDLYCTDMMSGPLVWVVCSLLCISVSFPVSVQLLCVLVRRRRNGLSNDTYMVNLSIMDLLHNLFLLPNVLNYLFFQIVSVSEAALIFRWLSIGGRPLMNVCICVDCYMAVVCPITYMRIKDKPYRVVACVSVWTFTIFISLTILLHVVLLELSIFMLYPLCLSTIAFCNISVLHTLRKPDPSGKVKVHPQKQRALQTITNSLVMFLVSYLPPLVSHSLSPLLSMGKQELLCHLFIPSYIGPCLGSAIMPVLCLGNLGNLKLRHSRWKR